MILRAIPELTDIKSKNKNICVIVMWLLKFKPNYPRDSGNYWLSLWLKHRLFHSNIKKIVMSFAFLEKSVFTVHCSDHVLIELTCSHYFSIFAWIAWMVYFPHLNRVIVVIQSQKWILCRSTEICRLWWISFFIYTLLGNWCVWMKKITLWHT